MPLGEIIGEVIGNSLLQLIIAPLFRYTGAGLRKLFTLRDSDFEYILLLKWNGRIGLAFYCIIGFLLYKGCKDNTKQIPVPVNTAVVNQSSGLNKQIKSIDSIVVLKSQRKMFLYENKQFLDSTNISLGDNPIGHKHFEGDEKTPEGLYKIDYKNAKSHYNKSLHISYPNKQDKKYASRLKKSPGGEIFIHGLPNNLNDFSGLYLTQRDWTDGCIAVPNYVIEVLFSKVKKRCPILILP